MAAVRILHATHQWLCNCDTGWNGENYKLLAADLTNISELNTMLSLCHVDVSCPTLIVSEVVMTYLPITRSVNASSDVMFIHHFK